MSKSDLRVYASNWSSNREEDQFVVYNPMNGEPFALVQGSGAAEVDACVKAANDAFNKTWRWVSPHD